MAIQSLEIGTLINSINSKGSADSNKYSADIAKTGINHLENQEDKRATAQSKANVTALFNTFTQVAGTISDVKTKLQDDKDELDYIKGSTSMDKAGQEGSIILNNSIFNNEGTIKNGEIDMGQTYNDYSQSVLDSITDSGYSTKVKASLTSQWNKQDANFKAQMIASVQTKIQAEQVVASNATFDKAVQETSSIETKGVSFEDALADIYDIDSYSQINSVVNATKHLTDAERTQTINKLIPVAQANKLSTYTANTAVTEGLNTANMYVDSVNSLTVEQKTAIKANNLAIVAQAKTKIAADVDNLIKNSTPIYINADPNSPQVISYKALNDAIDRKYSGYSDEIVAYGKTQLKSSQTTYITNNNLLKSQDEINLIPTGEQALAESAKVNALYRSGTLYGMETKTATVIKNLNGYSAYHKTLSDETTALWSYNGQTQQVVADKLQASFLKGEKSVNQIESELSDMPVFTDLGVIKQINNINAKIWENSSLKEGDKDLVKRFLSSDGVLESMAKNVSSFDKDDADSVVQYNLIISDANKYLLNTFSDFSKENVANKGMNNTEYINTALKTIQNNITFGAYDGIGKTKKGGDNVLGGLVSNTLQEMTDAVIQTDNGYSFIGDTLKNKETGGGATHKAFTVMEEQLLNRLKGSNISIKDDGVGNVMPAIPYDTGDGHLAPIPVVSDKYNNEYTILNNHIMIRASIKDGWHMIEEDKSITSYKAELDPFTMDMGGDVSKQYL